MQQVGMELTPTASSNVVSVQYAAYVVHTKKYKKKPQIMIV